MQLLARIMGKQPVHEAQKLHPTPTPVVPRSDQAGGHLQRGKQRGGAMTLILVIESGQGLAVGQVQPALGALQRLDMRLFVHAQHHGVLRRIQIQPHDVGGLLRKAGIGADAPAATPLQRNPVPTQHPPYLMRRHILEPFCQKWTVPARVARWRGLVQHAQDALSGRLVIDRRLAAARGILKSSQARPRKPAAPFAHGGHAHLNAPRHLLVALALGQFQNHTRPPMRAPLSLGCAHPTLQRRPLVFTQDNLCRSHNGKIVHT